MEPVTVYVDLLFLVNFTVDYFLLSAVAFLRRINYSKLRLLLGAAAGGIYSCLIFLTALSPIFTFPGKVAASAIMVLLSFKWRSVRSYLASFICMHAVSIGFSGVMLGVEMLFSPHGLLVSNGEFYINISVLTLIAVAAVSYVGMLIFSRLSNPVRRQGLHSITVTVDGQNVTFTALFDSGNQLTDRLTGAKVIVAGRSAVDALIPDEVKSAFSSHGDISAVADTSWSTRVCAIPYSTLSGGGILPAFRPDRVTLDGVELEQKTVIAVRQDDIHEKYQAIVGFIS